MIAQRKLLRDFMQSRGAHQVRFELGETALGIRWKTPHQAFAHHEAENRVAQEFELFIIRGGLALGRLFVNPRFVSQRPFEQLPVTKSMTEPLFEGSQLRVHTF